MSDIFDEIVSDRDKDNDTSSANESQTILKGPHASMSASDGNSNPDPASSSSNDLAQIMTAGFEKMSQILSEFTKANSYDYEDEDDDDGYVDDNSNDNLSEKSENYDKNPDFFDELSGQMVVGDKEGPEIPESLAKLADKFLRLKLNDFKR